MIPLHHKRHEILQASLSHYSCVARADNSINSDVCPACAIVNFRYSLAGQDTRPSPERPGFESRWRKILMRDKGTEACWCFDGYMIRADGERNFQAKQLETYKLKAVFE